MGKLQIPAVLSIREMIWRTFRRVYLVVKPVSIEIFLILAARLGRISQHVPLLANFRGIVGGKLQELVTF